MSNIHNDNIKEVLLLSSTQEIDKKFPNLNETDKEKLIEVLVKIYWNNHPDGE